MTGPFTRERPADPPTPDRAYAVQECRVFEWIGQSHAHCDNCGRPLHLHCYLPPLGGARPLFHVRQWRSAGWVWMPVGSMVRAGSLTGWWARD